MSDLKTQQREWITHLVEATGLSLTALARKAGVHDSTLTRFMNSPNAHYALSNRTTDLLAQTFHVPFGQRMTMVGDVIGFEESDTFASTYQADEVSPCAVDSIKDLMVSKIIETLSDETLEAWKLNSPVLAVAGYNVGDFFILSRTTTPAPQDLVIIQHGDRNAPSYAARIYLPPFIVTAGYEPPAAMPELIDTRRMRVIGTVVVVIRGLRSNLMTPFDQNYTVQKI